jgi:ATP-binding cassette subfamily B protein
MSDGFLSRFFGQPDRLPEEVRLKIAAALPAEAVRAYAFCDLDPSARYAATWLVVTDRHLCSADDSAPSLRTFPLAEVEKFELFDGITNSRMNIVSRDRTLALSVQYSRRQARAVGNLQFIAEQTRKGLLESKETGDLSSELDPQAEYSAAMLESVQEAKASLAMPRSGVIMRLLGYLKPHRATFVLGLVASVAMVLLQLVPPLFIQHLIDKVLKPFEAGGMAKHAVMNSLWIMIAALAAIYVVSEFFSFIRLQIMAIVGEKISMKLREDVYNHMQRLSLAFFTKHPTGSLITRVSSDTDRLWDFITYGVLDVIVAVVQIAGVAGVLLFLDWKLALLVLLPVPFITWLFYSHGKNIQVLFLRIWRKWSAMTAVLSDVIPGIRVVKAFARERYEEERFRRKNVAVQEEAIVLHKYWTTFWPIVEVLMRICTLIVWIAGTPMVIANIASHGASGMSLGVFVAFTSFMWMFWGPVQSLGMMSRTLNRVTTSASRIFEVLDTVPNIVSKSSSTRVEPLQGSVSFEDVTFTYDGIRNILKGVTFDVKPGEMIGLVGPSGGGKTTLVNLICRFYDVKTGRIRIDGLDVKDHDLGLLRRQIGVVLQEPYLFHGTIAENIAYGSQNKGLKDIIDAARAAHAHEFICGFRDGYETVVGERGQTLSGGERQRISIARAILHDPRILILDEATSSVDTETEKKIQDALKHLVAGRTTFAIAHRLSTLSRADRLFVIEEGRLVEHGSHEELLAKPDGVYAKLHKTQVELHAAIAV